MCTYYVNGLIVQNKFVVIGSFFIIFSGYEIFRKFLKSKKVRSVGVHIESVSKQILDLY